MEKHPSNWNVKSSKSQPLFSAPTFCLLWYNFLSCLVEYFYRVKGSQFPSCLAANMSTVVMIMRVAISRIGLSVGRQSLYMCGWPVSCGCGWFGPLRPAWKIVHHLRNCQKSWNSINKLQGASGHQLCMNMWSIFSYHLLMKKLKKRVYAQQFSGIYYELPLPHWIAWQIKNTAPFFCRKASPSEIYVWSRPK